MAEGNRFNVITRRTDAMRRLSDEDRRALIGAAPNVIGFNRFAAFTANVRRREVEMAVRISAPGAFA